MEGDINFYKDNCINKNMVTAIIFLSEDVRENNNTALAPVMNFHHCTVHISTNGNKTTTSRRKRVRVIDSSSESSQDC